MFDRSLTKLRALCVSVALVPAALASAQQEYFIVDLGSIAGAQTTHLNDITQAGFDPAFLLPTVQVITVADGQGLLSAFRIVKGQSTPLGTLGGAETIVHGVNFFPDNPCNTTRLVGASQTEESFFHAFMWVEGVGPCDLSTLGGDESSALAINDTRQVVGWALDGAGEIHATLWDGIVGPCGLDALVGKLGPSLANDIDNYGHIVGQSKYTGFPQATAWVRDIDGVIAPCDLGAMGGDESEALAVDAGRTSGGVLPTLMIAAGWSEVTPGGARHAATWNVDTITGVIGPLDLGTLGGMSSAALAVTHLGDAVGPCFVGWSDLAPPLSARRATRNFSPARTASGGVVLTHAFIYDSTNGMRDLNDLIDPNAGWELTEAQSANSSGMITGIGEFNGEFHAYRLDPVDPPQACPTDSDNDGSTGILDFLAVLAKWGTCP